jgi:hypothetical protein
MRWIILTTLSGAAALVTAQPALASLSLRDAKVLATHAMGDAARKAARRTGAEIISFGASGCARRSAHVVRCNGWSDLDYSWGEGRCHFRVTVAETLSGGVTFRTRLTSCDDS